ncbi:DUF2330 domain-containing protein [Candidatus Uhrbacteria bacterium]|nr:DUF2330 domain-containing protein [Candidatus Uhrbacteria bacterium]
MKRVIGSIALFLFFIQAQLASACAIATFEPSLSVVEPSGKSNALLVWDGFTERLILDPRLKGNAQDFGMAFAFPSRPKVKEASRKIFSQLEEYTKPRSVQRTEGDAMMFSGTGASAPQAASPVEVLERREVGDFTVSILTATDAGALIEWLLQNQYGFSENDKANFEYYVAQGGYFFTALKIRTEARGEIPSYLSKTMSNEYGFTPIEFEFDTFTPTFPLRLARDTDPIQQLHLYTLANLPLVVWGGDISFAGKMNFTLPQELSALAGFDTENQWLTALDLSIDPAKIEEDMELSLWSTPLATHIFQDERPTVLFPEDIPYRSGIILSHASSVIPEDPGVYPPYPEYLTVRESLFAVFTFLFLIVLYVYISSALFSLARKLNTRRSWIAWIPVANIYLFVAMAKKRWWWFIWLCVAPIIAIVSLAIFEEPPYDFFSDEAIDIVLWYSLYVLFVSVVGWFLLIEHVMTSLARQRNRPLWWGPASVILPPLGLIFLGILAWGKDKEAIEPESAPALSEQIPVVLASSSGKTTKKKVRNTVKKSKTAKTTRAVLKKKKS